MRSKFDFDDKWIVIVFAYKYSRLFLLTVKSRTNRKTSVAVNDEQRCLYLQAVCYRDFFQKLKKKGEFVMFLFFFRTTTFHAIFQEK